MATVTVYTAERMKAIEDASVVSGEVVGDDLILTRFDATTVNAGNVRGPQGDQGLPGLDGDVTTAAMTTAISNAINALKATLYSVVNHGSNPSTARPTGYAGVIWYGSVQPTNMAEPDIVIRTDEAI